MGAVSTLAIATHIVARNPTAGPLNPRSNNSSRFAGGLFKEITAPNVPKGGGPGMKYGKVESIPWLDADNL
jgi:hypothetical protein